MNQRPPIVVQKFGGSSVRDAASMRRCADRVQEALAQHRRPVVVVSAMGDTTDDLLTLADAADTLPDRRELDQLLATGEQASAALMAMTLAARGIAALSLTGAQAGIAASPSHGSARITAINPARLLQEIDLGRVPVVAGFQGLTPAGDVATLGRGGSDTTAVALAGALAAECCDIYTDVPGVFTADPRVVRDAVRYDLINASDMLDAARAGAQVMCAAAVELAIGASLSIRVLHSAGGRVGTIIDPHRPTPRVGLAVAVALQQGLTRLSLPQLTRPDAPALLVDALSRAGLDPLQIDASDPAPGRPGSLHVLVSRENGPGVSHHLSAGAASLGLPAPLARTGLARLSAVGVEPIAQPEAAATLDAVLEVLGLMPLGAPRNGRVISRVVPAAGAVEASRLVHQALLRTPAAAAGAMLTTDRWTGSAG